MATQKQKLGNVEKFKLAGFAFEFGYIIALPLIIFLYAGKYLDERFGTHPFLQILGLLLALTATSIWLTRRFSEILKTMKDDHNQKGQN